MPPKRLGLVQEKRMGVWPLPGGVDKYADTVYKCLDFIATTAPTYEELMKWFVDTYPGVKGGRSTEGYVYNIKDVLFLAQESETKRFELTKEGMECRRTKDPELLFRILDTRDAGISEILEILRTGPLGITDINNQLRSRLRKNWATDNQTFFRVNWLMSLGKLKRQ